MLTLQKWKHETFQYLMAMIYGELDSFYHWMENIATEE